MQALFTSLAVQHEQLPRAACFVARRRADAACVGRVRRAPAHGAVTAVIVDGATSLPESGRAADIALDGILASPLHDADLMASSLLSADLAIAGADLEAQVSSVVMTVRNGNVSGASAGDCEAWFVPNDGSQPVELTAEQYRRPRIGDTPVPVSFRRGGLPRGMIVAGSDGLWVNAVRSEVFEIARKAPTHKLPSVLAYYVFVRKEGALPDDIAVVAVEV